MNQTVRFTLNGKSRSLSADGERMLLWVLRTDLGLTGTAACLVPGTTTPLAWYYAIPAVGISLLTVPLGLRAGERMRDDVKWAGLPAPAIAVALSLVLMVLFRLL
jgi:hypothetical protein